MSLTVGSLPLVYQEFGPKNGVPVVFLHGFPFSQAMWQSQVDLLKDQFRVITYDQRGHGQSGVGDGQYLLEFFVEDLFQLLDTLKIERAVLCGLSMGGYVVLRAAERSPERIRGLVLCDTRSEADSNEAKLKRAAGIKTIKEQGVAVYAEGFLKAVFTEESFKVRPGTVDAIRQVIRANSPQGLCGTLLAMAARTDTTASLSKIKVPTLILVGEQDAVTPPAAAESLHQHIVSSEYKTIPNAAHLSNLENPEVFNRSLKSFLDKIRT